MSNQPLNQLRLRFQLVAHTCFAIAATLIGLGNSFVSVAKASDDLPSGVEKITEIEGISEYKLSNGVQVLLFPDQSKPQFTINVTVLVGSRHEGYGETGMAHLLEHMLFKGTTKYEDIPALLKDRGVLNMNGTTSYDRTNYYETLPASEDNLEFAIEMEADRLINSLIRSEDLASEMTVVRSEFERGENSPQAILFQRIMSNAYEWHNYGKTTIGNRTDIMRVPVSNLRQFYKKFYQADNIMVVLAGKFDPEAALGKLEENFGSLKMPERELPKTYTEEPSQDGERIVVLRRVGDTQLVGVGYHVMSAGDSDYAAGQVLAEIVGTEPSGPLYQAMVETNIASNANSMIISGHDPGMILAMSEIPLDGSLENAKDVLIRTMESLDESHVNEKSVSRAVNKIMKRRERQFNNSERFGREFKRMESLRRLATIFPPPRSLEKVTKDDVLRVAKNYLVQSNRTVGLFEPAESPVRAQLPSKPDLAKALYGYAGRKKISEGEAFEPTPEIIERRTVKGELNSGIKYALLTKKTRGSVVNLSGELKYGDSENLSGQVAAAQVLPRLLSRGTSELGFQEFNDKLTELSATHEFLWFRRCASIQHQAKRDSLSAVLELLEQALRSPSLDENELDIVKRQFVTRMDSMKSDPQGLAATEIQRKLSPYPAEDVRYSPTVEESIERMKNVTIDDVKTLHAKYLNGSNGAIAVVGDFDADTIVQDLTQYLTAGHRT